MAEEEGEEEKEAEECLISAPSLFAFQLISQKIRMCNQLTGCKAFVSVLEYLLAVGNYLNENAGKEKTKGFRLSSLTKVRLFLPTCSLTPGWCIINAHWYALSAKSLLHFPPVNHLWLDGPSPPPFF